MNLAHSSSPVPANHPNVALIHCHDLGDWLSCYGHASVPTPNLQAFADSALVFDNAFATSPLCTPARSSLFTGRSPHANGLMGLSHAGWHYNPDIVTLPETLGAAGYRTALLGLQHEDLDARVLGYEEVHGLGFIPRALEVAKMTENWLDHRPDNRPFSLLLDCGKYTAPGLSRTTTRLIRPLWKYPRSFPTTNTHAVTSASSTERSGRWTRQWAGF